MVGDGVRLRMEDWLVGDITVSVVELRAVWVIKRVWVVMRRDWPGETASRLSERAIERPGRNSP